MGLLINILHQSKKYKEIIRESIRMIRPQGKLLIIEWKNIVLPFGPPLEVRIKKDILKNKVQELGLKLEKEFSVSEYHYSLFFTKI